MDSGTRFFCEAPRAPTSALACRWPGVAPVQPSPRQNRLIHSLPAADYERIVPHLELLLLKSGAVVSESKAPLQYMYFPTTSVISWLHVMRDGASADVAVVGNEGAVGVSLLMGGGSTPSRAVVQSAGHAYRLGAQVLKSEFARFGAAAHLLLRYTQALVTQIAQTAVCNRHHSLDQQLCRWLLLSLDRTSSNELCMTHELMASMLGVRREGVTMAAGKLRAAGLIHYDRGRMRILDRDGLEQRSCECYQVVKSEYDRLLLKVAA